MPLAALAAVALSAAPAAASEPAGYDVSYPQCGSELPAEVTFAVVGVNGGRVFQANPCLGIDGGASQLAWAYRHDPTPDFYLNTANPGPLLSSYWPSGQVWPKPCAATFPENDSPGCAYDYGWNAARDSFDTAVAAADQVLGDAAPPVSGADWWLDVEGANTWETLEYGAAAENQVNDTAALRGARDYLLSRGVPHVGVYSTALQWEAITGGARMADAPVWYAGGGDRADATARCAAPSFTGGPVLLAQYAADGFDADVRC